MITQIFTWLQSIADDRGFNHLTGNGMDFVQWLENERVKYPSLFITWSGSEPIDQLENGNFIGLQHRIDIFCRVRGDLNSIQEYYELVRSIGQDQIYHKRFIGTNWLFETKGVDAWQLSFLFYEGF